MYDGICIIACMFFFLHAADIMMSLKYYVYDFHLNTIEQQIKSSFDQSTKEVTFLPLSVCEQDNSKTGGQILLKEAW